jgi:hypothetical protein
MCSVQMFVRYHATCPHSTACAVVLALLSVLYSICVASTNCIYTCNIPCSYVSTSLSTSMFMTICMLRHKQIVSQEGLEVLEEEVLRLLQGIDIDGSNTLDYREFLAATMDRNVFIREENMRCG